MLNFRIYNKCFYFIKYDLYEDKCILYYFIFEYFTKYYFTMFSKSFIQIIQFSENNYFLYRSQHASAIACVNHANHCDFISENKMNFIIMCYSF